MADAGATSEIAGWVQAGGVLAFAGAVLWELRLLRPLMAEVSKVLAAMLERERMRAEQRQQLISMRRGTTDAPPMRRDARTDQDWDSDVTDQVSVPEKPPRPRTRPGVAVGAYGPMKPKRDL